MILTRAFAIVAVVDTAMTAFAVWLAVEAGADAIPWAVGGGVSGVLIGLLMARAALLRHVGGSDETERTYSAAVGAAVGVVAARLLGQNFQVGLAWLVAMAAGTAVLVVAVSLSRSGEG